MGATKVLSEVFVAICTWLVYVKSAQIGKMQALLFSSIYLLFWCCISIMIGGEWLDEK
jgi:hypothetical protein